MKNYFNSFKKSVWVASAVLLCASCSDVWDEHYSTDYSVVPRESLAETISKLDNASQFVKILQNTFMYNGAKQLTVSYYEFLDEDQFMTVWVPSNEAINALPDSLKEIFLKDVTEKTPQDHKITGQEFIQNYLARYSHPAGGDDEKIYMLSKKMYTASANSIDGVNYLEKNIACRNGILHTLNGRIEYRKSLYEYITTEPAYTDVLGKFFAKYTKEEVDPNRSVQQGINADGEMEYVDSVLITKSILMDRFGLINEEDSNFAMVLPTPEAWQAAYDRISQFYDYGRIEYADSIKMYWTQNAIMTDMFFNMNIQHGLADSAISTTFDRYGRQTDPIAYHTYYAPYSADGLFVKNRVDSIRCSNGYIIQVNTWPFADSLTWLRPIKVEGENADYKANLTKPVSKSMRNGDYGKISSERILQVAGEGGAYSWQIDIPVKNNLKGKYKVYMVIAPNTDSKKPIQIHPTIYYNNAAIFDPKDTRNRDLTFNNVVGKVDTILIQGKDSVKMDRDYIEIPYCDYKTDRAKLSVRIKCSMKSSEVKNYNTTMNLDCIILEPILE
ncbi:MAG: hypothetical protein MJY66_03300 [Bacteroidaceae bacterium]|nr:hypothetical protein [Bacteroidaceae bacterium]